MSYSFSIRAGSRKMAKEMLVEQFATVVKNQPTHESDVDVARDAAAELLEVVEEPSEGGVYKVDVSGSLSWTENQTFVAASLNVSVSVVPAV